MIDAVNPCVAELPNFETTSYIMSIRQEERWEVRYEYGAHFCLVARIYGRRRSLHHLGSKFIAILIWASTMCYTFDQSNQLVPDTGRALIYHGGTNALKVGKTGVGRGQGARNTVVSPKGAAGSKMSFCVGDRLHLVFAFGMRRKKGGRWRGGHSRGVLRRAAGIGR